MKRLTRRALVAAALLVLLPGLAFAKGACATIQSGTLVTSDGDPIVPGYDQWGYNYQAKLFNGGYCDAYHGALWCQAYADVDLSMKWNDAWLSNADCDGDRSLDRPSPYIGSGAWITNHMRGIYEDGGKVCDWTWFTKIVAVPSDAVLSGGVWRDASGAIIGPAIWGEFATVQSVYNDPCGGYGGLELKGVRPGLGNWEDPHPAP